MLDINHLSHRYGQHVALRDVSFTAERGVVGLLGRNGAGKSTLLRILATLLKPTEGNVQFAGADALAAPDALRRAAAYLPQDMQFPPDVSARRYVRYLVALRGGQVELVDAWLTKLGLGDVAAAKLSSYSGGMRQRVGLAYALACDAQILLLDEPTQGLDPWERIRFYSQLAQLAADRLILFSTHIVSDIEAIAARLLVLDAGELCYDGTPAACVAALNEPVWRVHGVASLPRTTAYTITAVRRLHNGSLEIRGIGTPIPPGAREVAPTLEDVYLRLTDHRHASAAVEEPV